jgi:thiamine-phosphate pyrophosphorylase
VTAPPLILVTDPAFGDAVTVNVVRHVAAALPRGALAVQLRGKKRLIPSLRVFAAELRAITREAGAWLIVNGAPEIARDAGADGVHLGSGAPSVADARRVVRRPIWISTAAHSDDDVRRAGSEGADAVLVSPIFATRALQREATAKTPRGLEALRAAWGIAPPRLRIYALGGVTACTAASCVVAGADGVALIRSVFASADPAREARAIYDAVLRTKLSVASRRG